MVKKPKKKQETPETGEEVLVSAPQKPDVKSKKRKRQESKSEPVEIEAVEKPAEKDADAAERLRRALQRDIQQLVLRLRSEGKSKAEIKSATHELKAQHGAVSKSKSLKSSKKQKWEANAAERRKTHLQRQHDLVVIPVVWRGRHDKLDVLQAAENVKACLAQQGLDVWLDSRRHLTPGQKFSHWEHRGVMLRVEIGPQDLQAQVCQVCKAKTAGDYQSVERKQVPLPPAGARSLLLRLKEWGLSQLDVERRDGDSEDEAPEVRGRHQKPKASPEEEDEVQGSCHLAAAQQGGGWWLRDHNPASLRDAGLGDRDDSRSSQIRAFEHGLSSEGWSTWLEWPDPSSSPDRAWSWDIGLCMVFDGELHWLDAVWQRASWMPKSRRHDQRCCAGKASCNMIQDWWSAAEGTTGSCWRARSAVCSRGTGEIAKPCEHYNAEKLFLAGVHPRKFGACCFSHQSIAIEAHLCRRNVMPKLSLGFCTHWCKHGHHNACLLCGTFHARLNWTSAITSLAAVGRGPFTCYVLSERLTFISYGREQCQDMHIMLAGSFATGVVSKRSHSNVALVGASSMLGWGMMQQYANMPVLTMWRHWQRDFCYQEERHGDGGDPQFLVWRFTQGRRQSAGIYQNWKAWGHREAGPLRMTQDDRKRGVLYRESNEADYAMILTDTDLKFEAENSPEANVTLQLCKSKMDHEASGGS
ncbi:proS [Symbiodinium necroappetens]|uniref:ProS protein n=1 Tax=Symbiodinium necroappetens TaxID=1628268 RepID=A0A813CBT8_9DINO|nr:proS [Symbiodinium necroappetens]